MVIASKARIANCVIRDNGSFQEHTDSTGLSTVRSRPASGLFGWQNADLTIESNEFSRNAEAITLGENTRASIRNNLIEGFGAVDKLFNEGINLMCDADATVERN